MPINILKQVSQFTQYKMGIKMLKLMSDLKILHSPQPTVY